MEVEIKSQIIGMYNNYSYVLDQGTIEGHGYLIKHSDGSYIKTYESRYGTREEEEELTLAEAIALSSILDKWYMTFEEAFPGYKEEQ